MRGDKLRLLNLCFYLFLVNRKKQIAPVAKKILACSTKNNFRANVPHLLTKLLGMPADTVEKSGEVFGKHLTKHLTKHLITFMPFGLSSRRS